MQRKVYILEGLDCANCAAKIENKLSKLDGLKDVSVTYATQQLRFSAEDPEAMLPEIQKIVSSVEPDTKVVERTRRGKKTHDHDHHHEHGESCGCGHDHDHEEHEHDHHEHGKSCGYGHDHDHDHDHEEHEHHHHEHGENCGCGHDHEEHEHHHHEHGESCGCGHDHDHEEHEHHHHEHGESCGCGCGHDHHDHHEHVEQYHDERKQQVYTIEGLDCANCAAKVEAKIQQMPEVQAATLVFATKQLRVTADNHNGLMKKMEDVANSVESGVTITPRQRSKSANTKTYIIEGLDCANCAAKVEAKLQQLDGVEDLTITFATKQMKVTAKNPDDLLPEIQRTIDSVEDGVTVIAKDNKKSETKEKTSILANPLTSIFAGAILFVIGFALVHVGGLAENDMRLLPLFAVSYLILGGKVLVTAGNNIAKGQVFDENFLMCIATLGAFAIQQFPEAVGVMLFYRIGEYFEDRATEQSRTQIMEAVDMRPEVVNLVVENDIKVVDAEEAEVGDIVLVRPGDRIPLDGVIVDGESRIDTSPVTGEPVPVMARKGDSIVSGCVNQSGQLKVRVEKVLEESMVTRILDSVENAAASKPNIDKFITKFARVYTPIVVFLALAVAFILPFIIPNWHMFVDASYTGTASAIKAATGTASVYTALTFLVISCPCALVLSIPLAFFSGIGAASKKGILFKGGLAIEGLSGIKAIVMDKTGTITEGNFIVQNVNVTGNEFTADELLAVAASCEMSSTHPIANSIVEAAKEKGLAIERPAKVEEIAGHGVKAQMKEGEILCGNRKLMDENHIDMSAYKATTFGSEVFVACNGKFVGDIVISDTVKNDAAPAIASIKKLGITTAMLTGDAQESAEAVAKETGVDEVHAKLLPQDKLSELKKIRQSHGAVMFVGDGINDAPVLAGADVGAAMGSGADAAIEAADVVFMNSEMNAIPEAIDIAKQTSRISWQNVYFALAVKIIVMLAGMFGFANMWAAVFADTGVSVLCLLNSIRILKRK